MPFGSEPITEPASGVRLLSTLLGGESHATQIREFSYLAYQAILCNGVIAESRFFEDSYYQDYLKWLKEAAECYACVIHTYVLIANHVLCEASHNITRLSCVLIKTKPKA